MLFVDLMAPSIEILAKLAGYSDWASTCVIFLEKGLSLSAGDNACALMVKKGRGVTFQDADTVA